MLWLSVLLSCLFFVAGAAVICERRWLRRHVRHGDVLVIATLCVAILSVPTSVSAARASVLVDSSWMSIAAGVEVLALVGLGLALFTWRRAERVQASPHRVLVIAAHPDDLELACGGSLARFADRGHEVRAIVMCRGGRGGDANRRVAEAANGAQALELAGISVHEFTDARMATEIDEMVRLIEAAVSLFTPDIILTHSQHDQHQDHHAVHLATLRAARRSSTILCFESPSVTSDFNPRYFVDISDYVDVKMAAISAHRDQSDKPYMGAAHHRGSAVFRGAQAKVEHAEGFEVVRALSSNIGDL